MKRFLCGWLVFFPAWAWSQSALVTLSWPDLGAPTTNSTTGVSNASKTVGPDTCGDVLAVAWQVQMSGVSIPCSDFRIWVTATTSCADEPASSDLLVHTLSQSAVASQPTGQQTFKISDLPIFSDEDGKRCAEISTEKAMTVCASLKVPQFGFNCGSGGQFVSKPSTPLTLNFDSEKPDAPVLESVAPLDSSLSVKWSGAEGASFVTVVVLTAEDQQMVSTKKVAATQTSVELDALENGVTYSVYAYAEDAAGNQSANSNTVTGTPVLVSGFWNAYRAAGGADQGGCSSAGGMTMATMGLWVVAFSRRRRRWGAGFAVVAALMGAQESHAQAHRGESERSGVFEFKLGSVLPRIDSEPALNGNRPFRDTFGSSSLLLAEVEVDRQLFQAFGSLGLGFSVGYAEKYGSGRVDGTGEESAQRVGFMLMPMKLMAVYRLDYAALKWGFPLVPYAKGGLAYTAWWTNKGGGVEFAEGVRGAGGRWGLTGTLGVSFLLDVLDPRLARDFDSGLGVNHTYLFGEWVDERITNFNRPGLNLSSRRWMFGLAFEY